MNSEGGRDEESSMNDVRSAVWMGEDGENALRRKKEEDESVRRTEDCGAVESMTLTQFGDSDGSELSGGSERELVD